MHCFVTSPRIVLRCDLDFTLHIYSARNYMHTFNALSPPLPNPPAPWNPAESSASVRWFTIVPSSCVGAVALVAYDDIPLACRAVYIYNISHGASINESALFTYPEQLDAKGVKSAQLGNKHAEQPTMRILQRQRDSASTTPWTASIYTMVTHGRLRGAALMQLTATQNWSHTHKGLYCLQWTRKTTWRAGYTLYSQIDVLYINSIYFSRQFLWDAFTKKKNTKIR